MEDTSQNHTHIKGWAIDADPQNDPTYPMKHRIDGHKVYERKGQKQQPLDREILHSNERPNVSAVFGLGPVASGLSGQIRRFAFQYSENSYGHWLPLLLADRVNEVEGMIADLREGKFPNVVAEKGWPAQWKYDKSGFIKKMAAYAAMTAGFVFLLRKKRGS